jgi:hypothetical protein
VPHASDERRLRALHEQLAAALQSQDWRAVGEVDQAIRQCLEQLPREAQDPSVQTARQQLKRLHGQALKACAEECERLRLLLVNHLEYAEGRAAYQRIDMYQAGDGR